MDVEISENNDYMIIDNKHQIKIVGKFQNPYFCVEDACHVFGYSNLYKLVVNKLKKVLVDFDENECDLGHTHVQNLQDIGDYTSLVGLFYLAETKEYEDAVFEDIFSAIKERGDLLL